MNIIQELQMAQEKRAEKINKITRKWVYKRLIPYFKKMATKGAGYVILKGDMPHKLYADHLRCPNCGINKDEVKNILTQMGFCVDTYSWTESIYIAWGKKYIKEVDKV